MLGRSSARSRGCVAFPVSPRVNSVRNDDASLIEEVAAGDWTPSWDFVNPNWGDDSIVGFEFGEGLSEEAAASLDEFIAEMEAFAQDPANEGSIFLWDGPLNLQDGTELAAEGEAADLLEIWYLPQLLEGMTGASN